MREGCGVRRQRVYQNAAACTAADCCGSGSGAGTRSSRSGSGSGGGGGGGRVCQRAASSGRRRRQRWTRRRDECMERGGGGGGRRRVRRRGGRGGASRGRASVSGGRRSSGRRRGDWQSGGRGRGCCSGGGWCGESGRQGVARSGGSGGGGRRRLRCRILSYRRLVPTATPLLHSREERHTAAVCARALHSPLLTSRCVLRGSHLAASQSTRCLHCTAQHCTALHYTTWLAQPWAGRESGGWAASVGQSAARHAPHDAGTRRLKATGTVHALTTWQRAARGRGRTRGQSVEGAPGQIGCAVSERSTSGGR